MSTSIVRLTPELKKTLSNIPLCQALEPIELDMLVAHSQFLSFPPGELIIQQGKKSPGMYIILEGTALVTAKILGEGGTYIATLTTGNLFGEINLLARGPSPTSVLASTQVQCLLITSTYFDVLALFFPKTKNKITRAIAHEVCNRLKDMYIKITSFMLQSGMTTRSVFGEVIKSLTHPSTATLEEAKIDQTDLKECSFFADLSDEEYTAFLKHTSVIKAPKQCTLLQEGEREAMCYMVLHGAVQSSIIEDNKVAKLSVLGPFSVFANISVVDEQTSSLINYMSCERAILFKFSESEMHVLKTEYFTLWTKLFDLMCKSFVELERAADKLDIRLNSEFYNR